MDILYTIHIYSGIIYSPHEVPNLFDFLCFYKAQKMRIFEEYMLFIPRKCNKKYNKIVKSTYK